MTQRSMRRGMTFTLVAALAALVLPTPARAQDRDDSTGAITVPAGATHDGNLYAFGSTIRIDGFVTGDVVGAGQTVQIGPEGRVEGDVLAAAYAVQVDGIVDGDVRAAAFMIEVGDGGTVGGDLAAVGYGLDVQSDGSVGGDVLSAAYQLVVDGAVGNDIRFAGAALVINGTVAGDVNAQVAGPETEASEPFAMDLFGEDLPSVRTTAQPGLTVGPEAEISGTLTYTSTDRADIPSSAQAGGVAFSQRERLDTDEPEQAPTPWWLTALRTFAALAIVGLLLLWLAPRIVHPAVSALRTRPLPAIGYGVVAAVGDLAALVALVIAFILVIVVIGLLTLGGQLGLPAASLFLLLAALLTFGFVVLLLVGTIVSAQCLGQVLLRGGADDGLGRRVGALLLGAALLALLIALPAGLGTLAGLVIALFGVGGLVLAWAARRSPPPTGGDIAVATPLPGPA